MFAHNVRKGALLPGQYKVTQAQFEQIAVGHVTELWSKYGELTEIWFDGGYTSDMKSEIQGLLQKYQSQAACFGGYGVSSNPVGWVGTESGFPGGEIWSTGTSGRGDPNSTVFCPKGCDTTLQDFDTWFWEPVGIRSLAELIAIYHATVGMNGMLEMDFAINRDGVVDPTHAARYAELGEWIRKCYGKSVAGVSNVTESVVTVTLAAPAAVDRVMVREDLRYGQAIREFAVEVQLSGSTAWEAFGSGALHSVGNKRILLSTKGPLKISAARLTVTALAAGVSVPHVLFFGVFAQCPSA